MTLGNEGQNKMKEYSAFVFKLGNKSEYKCLRRDGFGPAGRHLEKFNFDLQADLPFLICVNEDYYAIVFLFHVSVILIGEIYVFFIKKY